MPDKYDEAIEYLVEWPEDLDEAWGLPDEAPGGFLFQFCEPDGNDDGKIGCLTMVHRGFSEAFTSELTAAIRADNRLHCDIDELYTALLSTDSPDARRAILQPYAEWQRRMDREIRGK